MAIGRSLPAGSPPRVFERVGAPRQTSGGFAAARLRLVATRVSGAAQRHVSLGLADDDLLSMYRTMVTARLCDEAQFRLKRQGKAPFVVPVSCLEGCWVGTALPDRKGTVVFLPYYG